MGLVVFFVTEWGKENANRQTLVVVVDVRDAAGMRVKEEKETCKSMT